MMLECQVFRLIAQERHVGQVEGIGVEIVQEGG
jgi:hypothetical protein